MFFATAEEVARNDWKQGIGIFFMLLGMAAIIWVFSRI